MRRRKVTKIGVDANGCPTERVRIGGPMELDAIVHDCLERGLFTVDQAVDRLAQPDMTSRRGAETLRGYLAHRTPGL